MEISLNELANKYGSDKGDKYFEKHSYAFTYDKYIGSLRKYPIRMLEIGINDPRFPGASLQMWNEYFKYANLILGFDIVDCKKYDNNNVVTYQGDQNSCQDIQKMLKIYSNFDLIIDDGSHYHTHQITSFLELFPALKSKGFYIIEDLHWSTGSTTRNEFKNLLNNTTSLFDKFSNDVNSIIFENLEKLVIIQKK